MHFFDQQTMQILQRVLLAVVLGLVIGLEREFAHKSAGMRTHALVAMGSAIYSIISVIFSNGGSNVIAAQIVTGVGFLGAGLIIFDKAHVQGLTTAAGVWVAAAVGMAAGFGLMSLAIWGTLLTLVIFIIIWPVEHYLSSKRKGG